MLFLKRLLLFNFDVYQIKKDDINILYVYKSTKKKKIIKELYRRTYVNNFNKIIIIIVRYNSVYYLLRKDIFTYKYYHYHYEESNGE